MTKSKIPQNFPENLSEELNKTSKMREDIKYEIPPMRVNLLDDSTSENSTKNYHHNYYYDLIMWGLISCGIVWFLIWILFG